MFSVRMAVTILTHTHHLKVKKRQVLRVSNIQADLNPNGARDPLGEQAEQFHQYG